MAILERGITPRVEQALRDTPVVVINGARQVGKTTLVRSRRYTGSVELVTLDDRRAAPEATPFGPKIAPLPVSAMWA